MKSDNQADIRIVEALIFASERAINIKEIKKKMPHIEDLKCFLKEGDNFFKSQKNLIFLFLSINT